MIHLRLLGPSAPVAVLGRQVCRKLYVAIQKGPRLFREGRGPFCQESVSVTGIQNGM
jgi:hypothetical protein